MNGAEAAALFYNPEFTIRKGAAPEPLKATLFGKGAIQSMDGEAHRARKEVFMSFMTSERLAHLTKLFLRELSLAARSWSEEESVILYEEMQKVLTKTACAWAGVPLHPNEVVEKTKDVASMFDSAGAKGMGHLRARMGRLRAETWIAKLVEYQRNNQSVFPTNSPAHRFAVFKDVDRELLSPRRAAIEILNILRPTVAISVYAVFIAHALAIHPEAKEKIQTDPHYKYLFIEEVRRFYPFFPSVVARAKTDFEFKGFKIPKGMRLILDVYGTNHSPRLWTAPEQFLPERFAAEKVRKNNLIPQGGGDYLSNHRCPGENPTILLMSTIAEYFVNELNYNVPDQDLEIDFSRLPALPKSQFVISDIDVIAEMPSTPRLEDIPQELTIT